MIEKCDLCGKNAHTIRFLVGFFMKKPVWKKVCRKCYEEHAKKGEMIK